jgi:hypothetical protein
MKLSDVAAKLTWMKSNAVRTLAAGTVAVAALAAVPAAHAQQFAVGVQFGGPQYGYAYAPAPRYDYDHDFYARQAWIEHERREAWERHEAMERMERERAERFYEQQRWREHEEHERFEHGYRGW